MTDVFWFSFGFQSMKLNLSPNFCGDSARNFCSLMNPQQCQSENACNNMMMLYFLGPNPPLNITVVEQDVLYAFVRWTAPNDLNKDNYIYRVTWSQNGYSMSSRTVYSTELNITRLVPGKNYTVTVISSYNNKYSQPATMTFTAGIVQSNPLLGIITRLHHDQIHDTFQIYSCVFFQKFPLNILNYIFIPFCSMCTL